MIGILAVALAMLMLWLTVGGGWFVLLMANMGQETVVQSVDSPNAVYRAELISSDQGALGGDTLIRVFVIGSRKSPQIVYRGEWGEFDNMTIYWQDDSRLTVEWESTHRTEEYGIEPW